MTWRNVVHLEIFTISEFTCANRCLSRSVYKFPPWPDRKKTLSSSKLKLQNFLTKGLYTYFASIRWNPEIAKNTEAVSRERKSFWASQKKRRLDVDYFKINYTDVSLFLPLNVMLLLSILLLYLKIRKISQWLL